MLLARSTDSDHATSRSDGAGGLFVAIGGLGWFATALHAYHVDGEGRVAATWQSGEYGVSAVSDAAPVHPEDVLAYGPIDAYPPCGWMPSGSGSCRGHVHLGAPDALGDRYNIVNLADIAEALRRVHLGHRLNHKSESASDDDTASR